MTGPRTPALVLAGLALLAGLLAVAGCGGQEPPAPPGSLGTRLDQPMSGAIGHLHLVDATGHPRSLADLGDKVVVLQDSMTLCQETCPMDTSALVRTARAVDAAGLGGDVEFVTVTVDPRRDTPAQLAAYRRLYAGPDGGPDNWMLLTGKPGPVDALWARLGVYHEKVASDDEPPPRSWRTGKVLTYDVEHSDELFFFGPGLHERFILEGMPAARRSGIPKKIYAFLSEEGRKNLHGSGDWTTGDALEVIGWLTGHTIPS